MTTKMEVPERNRPFIAALAPLICLMISIMLASTPVDAKKLKVKVIKACQDCLLEGASGCGSTTLLHKDKAGEWIPQQDIRIHAVSIPEQTEVSIYTDIEISTSPVMYSLDGHIFRAKYAGPGIAREPRCDESFFGSNVTTTNITFPAGYWIHIPAGTPIYVHVDVLNWSPFEIDPFAQDVYIYYSTVN